MLLFHRKSYVHFDDPLTLIPRALTRLYSLWVSWTYPFASKGRKLSIHYTCELHRHMAHRIQLGNSVEIAKDVWFHVEAPLQGKGSPAIIIDDNCLIARRTQISAKNYVHLERNVILSPSVLIVDSSHAYSDTERPIRDQGVTEGGRIQIGEGCWIGHGAAIVGTRGELVLGRNCVVAANSVVTRSFPAFSVISGNPARLVKQFDPVKGSWIMGSVTAAAHRTEQDSVPRQASTS